MRYCRPQFRTAIALIICVVATTSCSNVEPQSTPTAPTSLLPTTSQSLSDADTSVTETEPQAEPDQPQNPAVLTGAQNLQASEFAILAGQRVGLIANQTSATGQGHLADLMASDTKFDLAALFAPEHGLRGDVLAGETVVDEVDPATGLPIFSLYGTTRKPSAEMLEGLDVLVFDIQDVGARFYTFISTMGLAMQAAAEAEIGFVVLDRPNPLGGTDVAGFTTDAKQTSFISQYPVPSIYGLTAGELAMAIKGERWLPGLENLELTVVPMKGWSRDLRWPDLQDAWVPPSPALPTFTSALAYPGVVLFEATTLDYGRGSDLPFLKIVGDNIDGDRLEAELNSRQLPGVRFVAEQGGVRYEITDPEIFEPVAVGVHVLEAFYRTSSADPGSAEVPLIDRPEVFDRLAGSPRLRTMLETGSTADEIVSAWQADVAAFESIRQNYLLY